MSKKFKPEWETKCWGKVQHIFANPQAAVSKLAVDPGWMCSRHAHHSRYNMFAVTFGSIVVEVWRYGAVVIEILLQAGEVLTVEPGVYHRFKVVHSGELIEVYWPANAECICDVNDIHRLDEGGKIEDFKKLLAWVKKEEQK